MPFFRRKTDGMCSQNTGVRECDSIHMLQIRLDSGVYYMRLEILLSCMNLHGDDIIARSRIKSDTVIVNQCGQDDYREFDVDDRHIRIFSVNDTGLTKSRNYAIRKSSADICLLCDDDEVFADNYEQGILTAYRDIPEADVIIFNIGNRPARWGDMPRKLGYFDFMHVASWQISFKRESVVNSGLGFDERMGAGSGNGAEEEFKFLSDCRKKGLAIYYVPFAIADVAQTKSTWFKGYNEEFFVNRGNTTRYIMGYVPAVLYAAYYSVGKRQQFGEDVSWFKAFRLIMKGIHENRLGRRR